MSEIYIPKQQKQKFLSGSLRIKIFGGHVTKVHDHNECYLQFRYKLECQKSERHQKLKPQKTYSAHKDRISILGPELLVLHFFSEKNGEKKIIHNTIS